MSSTKTIWYCHHYAGAPSIGMSYRPYYLTREFNRAGMNAFIIGSSFHHLLRAPINQVEPLQCKHIDGVPFITLKTRAYKGNGLSRFRNMFDYVRGFKTHLDSLMAITGKPDVIIVSSAHPFHFFVLKKLANKVQAKLIFEVRDLWPLSLQELLNKSKWHPLLMWLGFIERQAYKRVDYVVSVLENAFSYMKQKGLSKARYKVIPNGTCIEEYQNKALLDEEINAFILQLKQQGLFLLGYTGALGTPNAMSYLLEAMSLLKRQHNAIHCVIVGDGHLKETLIQQASALELDNVTFFPSIAKTSIPAFLEQMDALYLGWNPVNIYQYGVSPNKLFDYMMAGKPIIESGGAPNSVISKESCGLKCEPAHPGSIAQAIKTLSETADIKRLQMGDNARNAVMKHYDYRLLAQQYRTLF